jgi:hypothetical protein
MVDETKDVYSRFVSSEWAMQSRVWLSWTLLGRSELQSKINHVREEKSKKPRKSESVEVVESSIPKLETREKMKVRSRPRRQRRGGEGETVEVQVVNGADGRERVEEVTTIAPTGTLRRSGARGASQLALSLAVLECAACCPVPCWRRCSGLPTNSKRGSVRASVSASGGV